MLLEQKNRDLRTKKLSLFLCFLALDLEVDKITSKSSLTQLKFDSHHGPALSHGLNLVKYLPIHPYNHHSLHHFITHC